MEVSLPMFMIGYKDIENSRLENRIQKHIAIEILLNMIIGKSSDLYQELYEKEYFSQPDLDYEFADQYACIYVYLVLQKKSRLVKRENRPSCKEMQENGLDQEHFERIKKKIYGDYSSRI